MKQIVFSLFYALALPSFTVFAAGKHAAGIGPNFKGPIGLQLYSLRAQFSNSVPATLDQVHGFGIEQVELAGTYNLTPEKFKEHLAAKGLKPISGHFPFERYRDDVEGIARDAKTLGLQYAGCAWIPHTGDFDEKTCRAAIAVFNRAGEALAKHGLKFFYHTHGYEFQPMFGRSEEHTSELQSQSNLVCRLLLEKKNCCIVADDILIHIRCSGGSASPGAARQCHGASPSRIRPKPGRPTNSTRHRRPLCDH